MDVITHINKCSWGPQQYLIKSVKGSWDHKLWELLCGSHTFKTLQSWVDSYQHLSQREGHQNKWKASKMILIPSKCAPTPLWWPTVLTFAKSLRTISLPSHFFFSFRDNNRALLQLPIRLKNHSFLGEKNTKQFKIYWFLINWFLINDLKN